MISNEEINKIVQFLTLKASNHGFRLSTIYLVKLLYLVDLAHARSNGGSTLTNWPWRFHDYGPWCVESYEAIESAKNNKYIKTEIYENEKFESFMNLHSPELEEENSDTAFAFKLAKDLIDIKTQSYIDQVLRKHNYSSKSLLNYVYEETEPMVNAIPKEFLDFKDSNWKARPSSQLIQESKKRKKKVKDLRAEISKLSQLSQKISAETNDLNLNPIYDSVYEKGIEAMEPLSEYNNSYADGTANVTEILSLRKQG